MRKELVRRAAVFSLAMFSVLATSLTARAVNLVQEFYLPMPEQQIYQANAAIVPGVGSTNFSTFSIVVTGDGTVINYDQWEDGYEVNLASPTQPSTQIWGDGNDANGIPPGFAHDPAGLTAGTVITLTNNVPLPRNPSVFLWDARDRVAANKALVISRAAWPVNPGPVFAGAAGVLSTIDYGTNYISPVGQDMTNGLFKYVGMFVMAPQNNTAITLDINGNGVGTTNIVLNQGESYLINGGIKKGGRITATKPVQADLLVGHVGASYASDWFTLYPVSSWDNTYYTPVSTAASGNPAYVYLYNPATNAIVINYNTRSGSGSFSIPGTNGVFQFQMPVASGASFTSVGGQNFFAICTVGANPAADTAYNWGFTLVPKAALTTEATVGWGPGSADGTVDGSPVWVTALAGTKLYVDYKGDHAGPLTDPAGKNYDTNFTLVALQSQKIYDPSKNQTGMRVYTADGTLITAAWGEDPDVAAPGNPYIDAGTTVLPFPTPVLIKTAMIVTDTPPAGLSLGDTVQYTVQIGNKGLLPLGNTLIIDAPSTNLSYIANSTTYNGSPISDSASGTPFPLDAPGYTIPIILSQGTSTFTYLYKVNASGVISNSINIGGTTITAATFLAPPPPNGAVVFLNFTDTNGVPVSLYAAGANVFVTMTNAVGNTASNTVQTISVTVKDVTHGDLETILLTETGTNTGVFRNLGGLATSSSSGLLNQDGILNVTPGDILSVSYTDPVYFDSATNTAAIQIPALTKQLYLSVNGSTNGTQALNRIDPVAYTHGPTRTSADIGSGGGGTVVVDASAFGFTASTATNLSISHTTGAGQNRLMIVGITFGAAANNTTLGGVSNVTYGANNLTRLTNVVDTSFRAQSEIWYLTNPPTGAANVVVSMTNGTQELVAGVITFNGVNLASPFGTVVTNQNGANSIANATVAVPSAANELVYQIASFDGNGTFRTLAPAAGQTGYWATNSPDSQIFSGGSVQTGAASSTNTWTLSAARRYSTAGVSIKPAAGGGGGPATNVTSFVQTPVFASAFTMPSNNLVTITNYITLTNGSFSANPAVTATLQYNGANFLTLTNPTYSSVSSNIVWSTLLTSNVTVPAGATISYFISNGVPGTAFHVNYDSTNAPSKISLPALTVIAVNTLGVYDAPYPNGNLVTAPVAGSTLYIRANVTDPFGSYDITSLGLVVTAPSSGSSFTNVLTAANVVTNDALSKTYEYQWATGPTTGGYNIAATAHEGTEGVVAVAAAGISLIFLDLGTPSTTEFTSTANGTTTNSYLANSTVFVRVTDLNRNTNATGIDSVAITVSSSSGDSELLTLFETGVNTGIFTNAIASSTNSVNSTPNGILYAAVGSILTASYTDVTDASDSTSATANIQPLPGVPGVVINKTVVSPSGGQVGVGQPVVYNLQIVNVGSTTLPSLKITDNFSAGKLSYNSASLAPDTTGSGVLTWNNLGAFTPGQSTNITVNFTTTAIGTATNSATANGSTATNSSSVMLTVNSAALNVTKILLSPANQPVAVGSNVTFRITIQNVGNTTITSLPFEDNYSGAYYQFVSATRPPNGSGFGTLIWTNLAVPALATNAIITNDVTMLVVGQGSPANNTAIADFAFDIFGNPVPVASSTIGVTTSSAGINGHVYNDINQSGVYTNGDTGLSGVKIQLFTDPNGDGDPSDGALVQLTTTDANGYYELLNLNLGHYVVVESDLAGYASSVPVNNRLPLNLTSLTTYTNNNFFDFIPAPSLYSTFSGTVYNDVIGTGTNTSQGGLGYVTIDLVQDVNSNGIADVGEPVVSSTVTDTNGNYSLIGITPGFYVIRETDAYGYYSTGDSQAPNNNQINFSTTNGIVSTNNSFFDRLSPVANNDTNSTTYFTPVTIYPLTNDVSPNGDALTISNATSAFGLVVINPGATNLTFTPTNTGIAIINYTVADQHGGSASAVITVGVATKALTITANSTSKIYGQTVSFVGTEFTVIGLTNGDSISGVTLTSAGVVNAAIVGSYGIFPSAAVGSGLANYAITYATSGTLTVNAATLGITANNTNRLYNTANPTFTYTPSGFVNGDNASVLSGTPSLTTTAILSSPIGTYPIAATNGTLSATNYVFSFTNGTLSVLGGSYNITWTNPTSITYGTLLGTNQDNATATIGGTYVYNPTNGVVLPAGTNTLTVVFTPSDTNYASTNLSVQLVVTPAPLTITANGQNKSYGTALNLGTSAFTSSGLVNSETIGGVTLTSAGTPTNAAAGNYAIVPGAATGGTFNATNYSLTYSNGVLTVNKASLTVTANSTNKIYGAVNPAFTTSYSGFVNGETIGILSGSPSLATTATTNSGVGAYSITATNGTLSAANYAFSFINGTLTIGQATLTVAANNTNRLYNTANPVFTASYSGFVNGETTSVLSGAPSLTTTAILSSPAGTYPINATNGTLSAANYGFNFVSGTLSISGGNYGIIWTNPVSIVYGTPLGTNQNNASATVGGSYVYNPTNSTLLAAGTNLLTVAFTPSDTNYASTNLSVQLVVTPAPLTITANSTNKIYGNAFALGTTAFMSSGLVNSQTIGSVTLISAGTPTNAAAGSYAIVPSAATGGTFNPTNYSLTYSNGTLTVNPASLTVTANNTNRIYGAANPTFAASYSGFVNGETPGVLTGSPSLTTSAATNSSAGSYTITATNGTLSAANYVFTFANGTLTIGQATLNVTGNSTNKIYGASNPTFTASYSGFVNGETTSVLSGAPSLTSSATTNSGVGSYPIVATNGTLSAANYSFAFVNGTLTVNAATLTVTANNTNRLYNTASPTFTASYSGFVNNETTSVLSGAPSLTTTAILGSPVGTYPITATNGTLSAANYRFSFLNGTLTVLGGSYGIIWTNPSSIVYGALLGTNQNNASATVGGSYVYNPTNSTLLPAATNTLTVVFTPSDTNYAATNLSVQLVVTPAPLTVTANSTNKIYGNTLALGTTAFTSSGLVNSETIGSVTLTSAGTPTNAAAGSYAIIPGAATGGTFNPTNYTLTYSNGTLTINKASLIVTANSTNKIYGAALVLGTTAFTSSGLVNNQTIGSVTLTSAGTPTNAAAGSYAIAPGAATGGTFNPTNYSIIYSNGTLTVNQATLTVSANSTNKIYGAANPVFTASYAGFVNGETPVILTGLPSLTTLATTNSGVGGYAIAATNGTLSAANYVFSFVNGTLTVNAATLTVTANNTNRLYNTANPTFTYVPSGFVNGETAGVLSGSPSLTTTAILSSPVGTYPIVATNGTLSAVNYVFSYTNGTLTISGGSYGIAWTNPASIVYGTLLGTNQNNASATVPGGYVYNPTNGTILPVGTNTLIVQFTPSDTNYAATNLSVQLVVSPAPLTITANSSNKPYNTTLTLAPTAFTSSGLVNSETIGGVTLSSAGAVSSAPVGSYPTTPSNATGGTFNPANYSLTYSNGTLTVFSVGYPATWPTPTNIVYGTALGTNQNDATTTIAGTFVYNPTNETVLTVGTNLLTVVFTPSDTNYAATNLSVNLVVTPAPLIVTADDQGKIYGQTLTLGAGQTTFTSGGLVNGDNIASVTLTSAGAASGAATGSYPIVPGVAVGTGLTNYSINYSNGTLTVALASPVVTWPTPVNIVYGTPLSALQNNATSSVPGTAVYNPTDGSVLNAGTNTLTVVYTPTDTNYAATNLSVQLIVTPAPLSVTATNAARLYGQVNPVFGGTINGIQNDDNLTAIYATSATTNSVVGGYPIIPTLVDPNSRLINYSITTNNGTLTVSPATLGITADNTNRIYGVANPNFTYKANGFVNGETASALSGAPSLTTVAVTNSPVGSYPVVATNGTLSATNYVFSFTNGTLTVGLGVYTVNWTNPVSIVYGTPLGTNQNNATSSVPGTVVYHPTNGIVLPSGTNTLTVVFTPTDTNYAGTNLSVQLLVTPAALSVTASNVSRLFGQPNPVLSGTIAGIQNGDNITATYSTTATTNSPAGPYPIIPALVDPNSRLANYTVTTNNGTLTVTNALASSDLVVVQSGPTSGIAGSNLVFTVSVTNRGPSVASGIIASNQLASGFTFVSASASGANDNGIVTWNVASLPVNGVTNLTVIAFAAEGGSFTNIASGTSSLVDTNLTNNDGSLANARSHTVVSALADVAIFKVGNTNGYRGSAITYTITATNAGPSTATNVVVQDNLPAGLVLQSASGSYTATAGAVTWSGVTLAPGTATNFDISLVVTSTITSFTNVAFSTSPTADPNPTNNNGSFNKSRVTTKVSPSADIVVLLVGPPSAIQGSNFVYSLTITNTGPSTSSNIVVSDSLPLNLTFVSASSGGKNTNNIITWPLIKSLPVGSSTNYTLTVQAPSGGIFTNIASALAVTFDPNATNNSGVSPASQALTTVAPAQLDLLAGTPVFNPQTGLFEENVTVTNIGSVTILGFRMHVGGLTGGITLYNATGTNNGVPYVDYLFPLDPSNTVTVTLELFSPLRVTPTNSISVEPILPGGIDLSSTNRSVAVSRIFTDTRIPGDTRFVIEFASVPGKTYNIIYSSDLVTWKVATPGITASANVTQWYDDGPPKTESKPASVGARYYRVITLK